MKTINIIENKLHLGNINKDKVFLKSFHLCSIKGEDLSEIYSYRFPVYEYKGYIILYCELLLNIDSGDLAVNVYDKGNRLFAPFYYSEYVSYDKIINIIRTNILKKLEELGVLGTTKMVEYK